MAEKATEIFASRRQTVTALDAEDGGSVSIDVTYEGTLAQDLPGGLEAGETVQRRGGRRSGSRTERLGGSSTTADDR
jgi:hypothetical protein